MPALSRISYEALPEHFAYQIRDFIRIQWSDRYLISIHEPLLPLAWKAVHFIVAEEHALFSHAAVVTQKVECKGQVYSCGGLCAVLTYPAFRQRGYGGQVVEAAREYVDASSFDVALLWTGTDKANFYARYAWEHRPAVKTYYGDKADPQLHEGFAMLRFLSERAKKAQADFENFPVYVGEGRW